MRCSWRSTAWPGRNRVAATWRTTFRWSRSCWSSPLSPGLRTCWSTKTAHCSATRFTATLTRWRSRCRCACRPSAKRRTPLRVTSRAPIGPNAASRRSRVTRWVAKPEVVHVALVDTAARVVWSVASPGPLGESVRVAEHRTHVRARGSRDRQRPRGPFLILFAGLRRPDGIGGSRQRRSVHRPRRAGIRSKTGISAPCVARVSLPELLRCRRAGRGAALSRQPAQRRRRRRWLRPRPARLRRTRSFIACRSTCCLTASCWRRRRFACARRFWAADSPGSWLG